MAVLPQTGVSDRDAAINHTSTYLDFFTSRNIADSLGKTFFLQQNWHPISLPNLYHQKPDLFPKFRKTYIAVI